MRTYIEQRLNNTQMGFQKNKSCTDAIFALKQFSERATEHKQDLYLAFVDQEKAFDRVDRAQLWITLQTYGVPQHLISLCQSIYANSQCPVRTSTQNETEEQNLIIFKFTQV